MINNDTMVNAAVAGDPRRPKRRRHPRLRFVALLLAVLMVIPGGSYARAMTYTGNASWQERSVEWVRDNGGSLLVNTVENWWYTRNTPPSAPPDVAAPKAQSITSAVNAAATPSAAQPSDIPAMAGETPLPGEGKWSIDSTGAGGAPVLYSTVVRPDPEYSGVVAAAAFIPTEATNAHLVAGTRQPGGTG